MDGSFSRHDRQLELREYPQGLRAGRQHAVANGGHDVGSAELEPSEQLPVSLIVHACLVMQSAPIVKMPMKE